MCIVAKSIHPAGNVSEQVNRKHLLYMNTILQLSTPAPTVSPESSPRPNLDILLIIYLLYLAFWSPYHFVYVANLLRTWENIVIEVSINQCVRSAISATAGLFSVRLHYILSGLYAIARPSQSVCPSVHPSHGWISQKRLKLGSCNFHHRVAQSL